MPLDFDADSNAYSVEPPEAYLILAACQQIQDRGFTSVRVAILADLSDTSPIVRGVNQRPRYSPAEPSPTAESGKRAWRGGVTPVSFLIGRLTAITRSIATQQSQLRHLAEELCSQPRDSFDGLVQWVVYPR